MFTTSNKDKEMNSKEKILKILREAHTYLSGELLASELNISRAAVWKAIDSLRKSGLKIDSSTALGYRLEKESNLLHKESILSLLSKEVKERIDLYVHQSIDSTNQEAKRLLTTKITKDTIIVAAFQSEGRGRLGRKFYSPLNTGLYLSYIVTQPLSIVDALKITSSASVAASRAIEDVVDTTIQIKWVNDLFKDGKKVAGILTEGVSNFESGKVESVIIGIGINLFPPKGGFPLELKEIATTLLNSEKDIINQLVSALITQFIRVLDTLQDTSIMDEYRTRSCILDSPITVMVNNNSYPAHVIAIEDDGSLRVKDEKGNIIHLNSGEISIRKREL